MGGFTRRRPRLCSCSRGEPCAWFRHNPRTIITPLTNLFPNHFMKARLRTCQPTRRIDDPQIHWRKRPFVENARHFAGSKLWRKHPSRRNRKSLSCENCLTHSLGPIKFQARPQVHCCLRSATPKEPFLRPGHIDAPIFATWQQGDALTKMKDDLAKNVPLGRLGDPDETALPCIG
jgi:hypothetical protein